MTLIMLIRGTRNTAEVSRPIGCLSSCLNVVSVASPGFCAMFGTACAFTKSGRSVYVNIVN